MCVFYSDINLLCSYSFTYAAAHVTLSGGGGIVSDGTYCHGTFSILDKDAPRYQLRLIALNDSDMSKITEIVVVGQYPTIVSRGTVGVCGSYVEVTDSIGSGHWNYYRYTWNGSTYTAVSSGTVHYRVISSDSTYIYLLYGSTSANMYIEQCTLGSGGYTVINTYNRNVASEWDYVTKILGVYNVDYATNDVLYNLSPSGFLRKIYNSSTGSLGVRQGFNFYRQTGAIDVFGGDIYTITNLCSRSKFIYHISEFSTNVLRADKFEARGSLNNDAMLRATINRI